MPSGEISKDVKISNEIAALREYLSSLEAVQKQYPLLIPRSDPGELADRVGLTGIPINIAPKGSASRLVDLATLSDDSIRQVVKLRGVDGAAGMIIQLIYRLADRRPY